MSKAQRWLMVAAVVVLSSPALAWGPAVTGGGVFTSARSLTADGSTTIDGFAGPNGRVGVEIGDRWNHEISFQANHAFATGHSGGIDVPVNLTTLAFGYTFSCDFLAKEGFHGFTPFLGVGLGGGAFTIDAPNSTVSSITKPYLEFHATAGARWTHSSGLGVRAELMVSTYGGFIGYQPSVGVGWRF